MTDDTENGAVPDDDAAVPDPPTVDEVHERQAAKLAERADA